MSGIGGILSFGCPWVEHSDLTLLGNALGRRGPDGGRELTTGEVGMAYRGFHTNKESCEETQPLLSSQGNMLVWDGRIDNREELLTFFPDGLDGDKTDVALVMAAYLKWHRGFVLKLVGDFAFSLWDPSSKTLILARDPFGTRTLYYVEHGEQFIWASTLGSLFALPGIELEVNDDYVAGCLALYPSLASSPYRNIHAVEPGHLVTISERRTQTHRFWKPDTNKEISYKTDQEYEEHFEQLFREAVRCRLRSDRRVWAELSGGLDSSSIVCMADKITGNTELETLSFIADGSSTFYDRKFIDIVEKKREKKGIHLSGDGHWVCFASPEDSFISNPSRSLCVADLHQQVSQRMRADGARVLISGLGGDQVTWSTLEPSAELGDLVFQLRPLMLHRRLQIWSQVLMRPYAQVLWQELVLPLSPHAVNARFQSNIQLAPWLNRDFVERMRIRERLLPPKDPFEFRLPSQRVQSSMISYIVMNISRGEYWEEARYEKTYPFLHRPLVEFLMSVPIEQKLRTSETRSLMRRALKDLLPERILRRKSKGTTGESFCRGIADQWSVIKLMLVDARIGKRGYVNQNALVTALDQARHGKELDISTLCQTLCLEIWLRSIEHHRVRRHGSPSAADAQSRSQTLRKTDVAGISAV